MFSIDLGSFREKRFSGSCFLLSRACRANGSGKVFIHTIPLAIDKNQNEKHQIRSENYTCSLHSGL